MITIFNWLPNLIDYFTFYGGGGKGGGSKNQTTTNNLDPVIRAGVQQNIDLANQIGARPYQAYEAPRLAGLSPEQYMAGARYGQLSTGPQTFAQGLQNINQYQNPYTQQVVDTTLSDLDRQRQMQQQQINAQAASRGAYGGSRQAVAEAENARNYADVGARTAAGLRSQGFDRATNMLQGDIGIAGQALGRFADFGEMQRQLQQQGLDLAYQDFMAEKQYPEQILALKSSAVNSSPAGSTQTATGLGQRSNFLGGAIGGGLSGYALGSQIGAIGGPLGAVGGAVLGGLLG